MEKYIVYIWQWLLGWPSNLIQPRQNLNSFFLQWLDPKRRRRMESSMRLVRVMLLPTAQLTRSAVTQAATLTLSMGTNAATTTQSLALTHPTLVADQWSVDLGAPAALEGVTSQLV